MHRIEFIARPAFVFTANKAQGQTLKKIEILLRHPFFSHGQQPVALSRVGSKDAKWINAKDDSQHNVVLNNNVVYSEVILP
ncbi:ATP-dependent DNA helicase [Elysia marginata]|uniref:ATP-dependent DNA helicase n=1 Tax=Elysia marginata TaxID=1093978 RepID=A0AAV4HCB9_9GAST|nr:ATP-dependent DNA helicase [Elysia marginata]